VGRLQAILGTAGVQSVFCKDGEADWLLLVNGCSRACLEEDFPEAAASPRCISVEGGHLDHRPVAEEDLPRTVWERIASIQLRMEKDCHCERSEAISLFNR
jgi:hypothetical protein